jgi:SnoaL-like protein
MQLADAGALFTSMLHAIDAKDWTGVRATFADQVDIDYSSLFGAPAGRTSANDLVGGWQRFAGGFDATQHITGPVLVTGVAGGAEADTHVRAYHYVKGEPGGEVWMVAGHYEARLAPSAGGWKIAGITLHVFYQEGNMAIPDAARLRAAAQ